jgi:hypothetical protein
MGVPRRAGRRVWSRHEILRGALPAVSLLALGVVLWASSGPVDPVEAPAPRTGGAPPSASPAAGPGLRSGTSPELGSAAVWWVALTADTPPPPTTAPGPTMTPVGASDPRPAVPPAAGPPVVEVVAGPPATTATTSSASSG